MRGTYKNTTLEGTPEEWQALLGRTTKATSAPLLRELVKRNQQIQRERKKQVKNKGKHFTWSEDRKIQNVYRLAHGLGHGKLPKRMLQALAKELNRTKSSIVSRAHYKKWTR